MNNISMVPSTVTAEISGAGSFFGSYQIAAGGFESILQSACIDASGVNAEGSEELDFATISQGEEDIVEKFRILLKRLKNNEILTSEEKAELRALVDERYLFKKDKSLNEDSKEILVGETEAEDADLEQRFELRNHEEVLNFEELDCIMRLAEEMEIGDLPQINEMGIDRKNIAVSEISKFINFVMDLLNKEQITLQDLEEVIETEFSPVRVVLENLWECAKAGDETKKEGLLLELENILQVNSKAEHNVKKNKAEPELEELLLLLSEEMGIKPEEFAEFKKFIIDLLDNGLITLPELKEMAKVSSPETQAQKTDAEKAIQAFFKSTLQNQWETRVRTENVHPEPLQRQAQQPAQAQQQEHQPTQKPAQAQQPVRTENVHSEPSQRQEQARQPQAQQPVRAENVVADNSKSQQSLRAESFQHQPTQQPVQAENSQHQPEQQPQQQQQQPQHQQSQHQQPQQQHVQHIQTDNSQPKPVQSENALPQPAQQAPRVTKVEDSHFQPVQSTKEAAVRVENVQQQSQSQQPVQPEVRAVWEGADLKIDIVNPRTGEKLQSVPVSYSHGMQERMQEYEVIRQVAAQAKFITTPTGEQRMTLQLRPEHLGQVDLRITLNHGEMLIHARVESATAQKAMESHIGLLREGLEKLGISLERLEVSVDQRENRDAQALAQERERERNEGRNKKRKRGQTAHLRTSVARDANADTGRRLGYNTMEYLA